MNQVQELRRLGSYQYKPCRQNNVRLLGLSPSSTSTAPLEGTLADFSLDELEPYHALSYTWATSDRTEALFIRTFDGCFSIKITPDLHDALIHIRSAIEVVRIWVDAVSIDQDNGDERANHISLVPRIYRGALSVYVWLGSQWAVAAGLKIIESVSRNPNTTEVKRLWLERHQGDDNASLVSARLDR
ncbi:heterokaryon incompatibility protein-domain-containing protein [Xylariomycetidae sp. FL2044]|nr:heterokaryon incompatibility protein-domain-containing protein [Xylariomycetidae sp. FL2044]